jgi:membrane protease YdiL (CAAX protease family)
MALIFAAELAFGWVQVAGFFRPGGGIPFFPAILLPVVTFLLVGIYEEMMFRGYILKNLAEGLNLPQLGSRVALLLAYLVSSSVFGLMHALNPNASLVSTLNIILAGLFLGLGYVLTGELALPIGLHITWNFFQGNVFGFPVSGTNAGASLVDSVQAGPALWTGAAFGPEAGLVGVAAMLLGALLIALWVRMTRGQVGFKDDLAVYRPGQERHETTL